MPELALASEFPTATEEAWRALVDKALKGGDVERRLVSRTADGIRIEPLYRKAENAAPVPGRGARPWRVAQRVDHPVAAEANALALADLEGGADALVLVFDGAPSARGFGLPVNGGVEALDAALAGAMLDLVAIRLEAGLEGRRALADLRELARRRGHALSALDLDLGLDPIGALAATGRLSAPWAEVGRRLSDNLSSLADDGFGGRLAIADGRPYHEAGAGEAQEIAAVLATALAYLRALEAGGHALGAARDALSVLVVADADEFLTVAKLRATRRLWAEIETACGLDPKPIRLHAETAWRTTTRRDPWVNLLRGTAAAFSAGIGGADAVTILPFTAALGLPDAFARRLARNTQAILLEEANLWRVADPAAGSGGFEALTDALAEASWAGFQEIEREGGIVASLQAGALQRRIAETRSKRERDVATRKLAITGTSEFPDIREAPVTVLRPPSSLSAAAGGSAPLSAEPLPSLRIAAPFEALRDLSDERLATTGARPRIFLANLGPVAAFSARATFARNAFEAGGIEAVTNEGFLDLHEMVQAYAASGTSAACLSSSDEIYGTQAAAAARMLAGSGCATILLAGRPGALEGELAEAGVKRFLYAGCDLLALLRRLLAET